MNVLTDTICLRRWQAYALLFVASIGAGIILARLWDSLWF
ncbi:hypothetical protein I603_0780 [Erythrobacter dokdonensis DSW-74]|uniref:Uncharacterized protein n=1 Tax=Erythrobacter dokdonensis DSW-74 TaxID=1300349 RepID=A0A1A7BJJ7_9SPHN|nr:hypothetical protein I603_0780 [Erythrobacter dokdonensis DSW-74]